MKLFHVITVFIYLVSDSVYADLAKDMKKRSDAESKSIVASISSEHIKSQSRVGIQLEIDRLRTDMWQINKTQSERNKIKKRIDELQEKLKKNSTSVLKN